MRGNYRPLTLAEIKEMDIVDYPATVGHEPVKVRQIDHWYLSPLRNEKTASFKVNRKLNRWYDHGIGRGGNLVNFAIEFYSCSVGEVTKMFGNNFSLKQPRLSMVESSKDNTSNAVQILSIAGKGIIGFSKVISDNLAMGIKVTSENMFNTTYFTAYPYLVSSNLASLGILLNQKTFTIAFVSPATKRLWTKTTGITENKAFEGQSLTSSNTWDANGNVTASTVVTKAGTTTVHTTATSTVFGSYVTSVPNRPTSTTATDTRAGQAAFSTTTTFAYNPIGNEPLGLDFSGLTNNLVTSYEYFNDGNLKKTTISPANLTARSTSATYDSKGRYPVTTTNMLSQGASGSYDVRWGVPTSKKRTLMERVLPSNMMHLVVSRRQTTPRIIV